MIEKPKFKRSQAWTVAKLACDFLRPFTERLIVAGSLRRRKPEVGDVEILYIPKFSTEPEGLFDTRSVNTVDRKLEEMLQVGTICKRLTVRGSETWGDKNKLAVHAASGIPVDFFAATEASWFNYLVCRTGGAENNKRIATAAQAKGWMWNPYGPGFSRVSGLGKETFTVHSERDVFDFVGLPYLEPWERL